MSAGSSPFRRLLPPPCVILGEAARSFAERVGWTFFGGSSNLSISIILPEQVRALQGQLGGSGRVIARLSAGDATAIGIQYPIREENVAFLEFSRSFRRHGLPVPEIYGEDLAQGVYLEEDLGDTTLFEFLGSHRAGDQIGAPAVEAYRRVVATLPRFQVEGGARPEVQGLLSARELRSPVDCLRT